MVVLFSKNRMSSLCWTSLAPLTTTTSRCPCTLSSTSDLSLSALQPDFRLFVLFFHGRTWPFPGFAWLQLRPLQLQVDASWLYLLSNNWQRKRPAELGMSSSLFISRCDAPLSFPLTWKHLVSVVEQSCVCFVLFF